MLGESVRRPSKGKSAVFYVGVDGCKEGWFAVVLTDNGDWDVAIFPDVANLWDRFRDAVLILIDVPIGLRDCGLEERVCDREARKLLGQKRGSSVFPAPCRPAVYADNYLEANEINHRLTGRRLSKQSWGIARKITEVDEFLTRDGEARLRIRETHPEVCFRMLAGRPIRHSKKTRYGFEERLEVLRSVYPGADDIVRHALLSYGHGQVARDDVLDAMVAAVSARVGMDGLGAIPAPAEYDSKGLRMEIVYPLLGMNGIKKSLVAEP